MAGKPNIIIILSDDMGFSDIGCYGGEVDTPNIDRLANDGIRFTQYYNTARCCPSRASLLTGLYPHQANIGHMTFDDKIDGYRGDLSRDSVTIAEALKPAGYKTYMSGKWHVTRFENGKKHNWPCQRGFDKFFGIITGAASYYHPKTLVRDNEEIYPEEGFYLTDAISDEAVNQIRQHIKNHSGVPFFQYVSYTAPHWPLHAHKEDIEKYKGRFDAGWDKLREQRMKRLKEMGIIHNDWKLSERCEGLPPWDSAENKEWEARRMEVYAAQIDRMDQGIGRIISELEETGNLDNTLIFFLSDNGGSPETITAEGMVWYVGNNVGTLTTWSGEEVKYGNNPAYMPGGEETYQSYGAAWANLSNTPFKYFKSYVHEGGIATPLIVHWPEGFSDRGTLRDTPGQLPDIMATCLDAAGAQYPKTFQGRNIKPLEGYSLVPVFNNQPFDREVLYWEHEGNKAVRKGDWKLVSIYPNQWELYNMSTDRTETCDVAKYYSKIVEELKELYNSWAVRCGVMHWDELVDKRK